MIFRDAVSDAERLKDEAFDIPEGSSQFIKGEDVVKLYFRKFGFADEDTEDVMFWALRMTEWLLEQLDEDSDQGEEAIKGQIVECLQIGALYGQKIAKKRKEDR